jgi:hypothetical protein
MVTPTKRPPHTARPLEIPATRKPMVHATHAPARPNGLVAVASIDPTQQYAVFLSEPITINGQLLLPRHNHQVSGLILTQLMQGSPNVVAASQPV